jgi:hypothetical protein
VLLISPIYFYRQYKFIFNREIEQCMSSINEFAEIIGVPVDDPGLLEHYNFIFIIIN